MIRHNQPCMIVIQCNTLLFPEKSPQSPARRAERGKEEDMKQITGQMSIFDVLFPERVNPLLEVAKRASPYWNTSRKKIVDAVEQDEDINIITSIVRNEYCPYEVAGSWGRASDNRRNELEGWDFRRGKVKTYHYDHEGKYIESWWSWADFTREIVDLIYSGEHGKGR